MNHNQSADWFNPSARAAIGCVIDVTRPLRLSILVVDDQADVLETTVELLQALGFEFIRATSGEAALRLLQKEPGIEVLLTDVVMPGMNGVTLAQHAKRLSPTMKVILVSGYASPELQSAIARGENFQFLAKPYRVPDLARILRL